MSKLFLPCLLLAFCHNSAQAQAPIWFSPPTPTGVPTAYAINVTGAGAFTANPITLCAGCTLVNNVVVPAPPTNPYITNSFATLTHTLQPGFTQPTDGTDVWCVGLANVGNTTPNRLNPAVVQETRTPPTGMPYVAIGLFQPAPQPSSGTTTTTTYPLWTKNTAACGGVPSVTFAAGSLTSGDTRTSVLVLVASY